MNGKRWVDGLFRERLEHREFPVEPGEFERMRTLLAQRNADAVTGTGIRFRTWWLSVLAPMIGLLWWTSSGSGSGMFAAVEPELTHDGTSAPEQVVLVGGDGNVAGGSDKAVVDVVAPRSDGGGQHETGKTEVLLASSFAGSGHSIPSGHLRPRSRTSHERAVNGGSAMPSRDGTKDDPGGRVTLSTAFQSDEVRLRDAISLMSIRRSFTSELASPRPVRRDVQQVKSRALGELHVFGAPLFIRTRSGVDQDGVAKSGSLYGLEYRVRAKYFSLATGIHYGSYGLQAGHGAADVELDYVEVPLLAGLELGFRRFGVLVQGGLSMDFLFNSGGRYPMTDARSGAGFPDDAFGTINYSWMLRPQATYRMNERLSVTTGPLWKGQLTGVAQEGLLEGVRASGAGVTMGLTWRLDRSTF